MSALQALSDALDAAHRRERDRLNEMSEMRTQMARLERRHEKDTQTIREQAALIDELADRPAREVAA